MLKTNKKADKFRSNIKLFYLIIGIILHCFIFIGKGQDFFDSFDHIFKVILFWFFYSVIFGLFSEHLFNYLNRKLKYFDDNDE